MQTGQVVGRPDARGEDAIERIVGRGDFVATLYRHLGADYDSTAFPDYFGRPVPIMPSGGNPITELSRD